jgi:hypothetical protein
MAKIGGEKATKTIIVVFTDTFRTKEECRNLKKYAFNTSDEVNEGDTIISSKYQSPMQVVRVLDSSYRYYNQNTGELSNEYNSTQQWEVKTLAIRDEDEEVVYGKILG